jgi:hypothetical protein
MTPVILTVVTIATLALWARRGERLDRTASGPAYRSLEKVTLTALTLSLCLAALATLATTQFSGLQLGPVVGGVLTTPVLVHAAFDPSRRGFWHHRRVRPFAALGWITLGVTLGHLLPDAGYAAPMMAALVFHRHLNATQALAAEAHEELAIIRQRLVTAATTVVNARLRAAPAPTSSAVTRSSDDKLPKAG